MLIEIDKLIKEIKEKENKISKETLDKIREDLNIRFTHESTKIEGNTLTIYEVKQVLVDKVAVGGKDLREIFEVINHEKAFNYVFKSIEENKDLSEELIKDIHEILLDNIFHGGIYRSENVRITGASFSPPSWDKVRDEMKFFIDEYKNKSKVLHPVNLAAWVHGDFIRIHPFVDGNGRCARLIMNFVLLKNNYLPIIILASERARYYEVLDKFGKDGEQEELFKFIEEKELQSIKEF